MYLRMPQLLILGAGLLTSLWLPFPGRWGWLCFALAWVLGDQLAARRFHRELGKILKATGNESAVDFRCSEPLMDRLSCQLQNLEDGLAITQQELAATRQELDLVLSSIGDCVLLVGSKNRILLSSRASGELLGWEQAELLGQNIFRVIRTSKLPPAFQAAEETGDPQLLAFKIGERRLEGELSPILGGQYLLILEDCTDKERLEEMRRGFASSVSHELRTPLTSILGFVDTLLDGAWQDPEACPHFLRVIKRETARLYRLVEDMLDLSQLERRRNLRPIVPVELGKVAERVLELVEGKAAEKGLELVSKIPSDFPLVMGDRDLLHQALLILLDNAISYTEEGFVELGARLTDGGKARIWVRDSGSGIAPEDSARIFERFYRVDKARSRHAGGTGLGLAIGRYAVERMDGEIGLDSEVGKGSTFWIELAVTQS